MVFLKQSSALLPMFPFLNNWNTVHNPKDVLMSNLILSPYTLYRLLLDPCRSLRKLGLYLIAHVGNNTKLKCLHLEGNKIRINHGAKKTNDHMAT
jgi:hypothetical protein